MDYSQYIRLKQEAANVYLARNKPIDASFLTMQKQQKAAFSGSSRFHTTPYFKGNPTLNPIIYDISSCPIDHAFTQGYSNSLKLSQQEGIASERAGSVLCCSADYSTAPSHMILLNPSTCSTILSSNNTNPLLPRPIGFVPSVFEKQIEYFTYTYPTNVPSMFFDGRSFVQASIDNVYSGISDFTIEFYVRPSSKVSVSPVQTIFFIGNAATTPLSDTYKFIGSLVANVPGKKYNMSVKISTVGTYNFGELLPEQWYHVAVMRFGNVMYFYLNGHLLNYANLPENIPASGSPGYTTYLSGNESAISIGGKYDGYIRAGQTNALSDPFTGHLTNFIWTKGMAVYTEPIGVPHVVTLKEKFKQPTIPKFIHSAADAFTFLDPYVAVGLLAETPSSVITNTRTPTATVSITSSLTINPTLYDAVTWEKI
jgi:hypothetical protein